MSVAEFTFISPSFLVTRQPKVQGSRLDC
jgi:hypothetical protein